MEFLGHSSLVRVCVDFDLNKTEVVKNWPRPLDPIHIRSFLGLSGYYRRFVDGFASIASPLSGQRHVRGYSTF